MNFQRESGINQQHPWKIIGMIWNIIQKLQQKATKLGYSPNSQSFYRKYRNTSLAILNNFTGKEQAIKTSKEYEVPLVHLQVTDSIEQDFVWKYVLNCYENAQILNQGFILWAQFRQPTPTMNQRVNSKLQRKQSSNEGSLSFYCNGQIYSSIKIKDMPLSEEQIYEQFNKLRAEYYALINKPSDSQPVQQQKQRQDQSSLHNSSEDEDLKQDESQKQFNTQNYQMFLQEYEQYCQRQQLNSQRWKQKISNSHQSKAQQQAIVQNKAELLEDLQKHRHQPQDKPNIQQDNRKQEQHQNK